MNRRQLIGSGAALAVLTLSGCSQGLSYSLTEAIRRLLTLSSQRALARLTAPGGFYESQVARITLPESLGGSGGGSILTRILLSQVLRDRMLRQVNRAAEKGAERAAPVIAQAILAVAPEDAARIVKSGGAAATGLLRESMGNALVTAMMPGVDEGLRLFDDEVVNLVLKQATNIDFAALRDDVTAKAANALYDAIGQEEIAIRADPAATRDPVLIAALAAGAL